jgi:hypothetical protein
LWIYAAIDYEEGSRPEVQTTDNIEDNKIVILNKKSNDICEVTSKKNSTAASSKCYEFRAVNIPHCNLIMSMFPCLCDHSSDDLNEISYKKYTGSK